MPARIDRSKGAVIPQWLWTPSRALLIYAGVLVVADLRFGVRALALAGLEHLNVRVGLVSQDGLKAMAVVVGEGQLRAGMRALATSTLIF